MKLLIFPIVIFILTIFAGLNYFEFMDIYEIFILIGAGLVIAWLGLKWPTIKIFFLSLIVLTLLVINLYQGNLDLNQKNFFLKYFFSSQSALMWMTFFYPLALLIYLIGNFRNNNQIENLGTKFLWIGTFAGFFGMLVRWYESYLIGKDIGHIPISNLYEVFVLFCVITSMLYLFYENKFSTKKLGSFVLVIINVAVAFILWYTFAKGAHEIQPLVPALQSYWMKIHVPCNFIGYGAFSISAMISFGYLLTRYKFFAKVLPSKIIMEDLMYKSIAVGFIFFTIATILGAIWAAEAWGGYWSWDPKETWALIVWLNYAAWLHLRLVKGLRGDLLAWWSLIGLLITTFAFLGVNLFLSGLHSYGEL
jgi:cytochrome c-type biogenesis protein CcsB